MKTVKYGLYSTVFKLARTRSPHAPGGATSGADESVKMSGQGLASLSNDDLKRILAEKDSPRLFEAYLREQTATTDASGDLYLYNDSDERTKNHQEDGRKQ